MECRRCVLNLCHPIQYDDWYTAAITVPSHQSQCSIQTGITAVRALFQARLACCTGSFRGWHVGAISYIVSRTSLYQGFNERGSAYTYLRRGNKWEWHVGTAGMSSVYMTLFISLICLFCDLCSCLLWSTERAFTDKYRTRRFCNMRAYLCWQCKGHSFREP